MQDLKRSSYNLRCKSMSALQSPRPQDSNPGRCIVCHRYMEHLRDDARCHTAECNALLEKLCIDGGYGVKTQEGAHTFIIFMPEALLKQRGLTQHTYDGPSETDTIEDHMCGCERHMKMPKSDLCAVCYRDANVKAARGHGSKPKRKKRHDAPVGNKIKGLEKLLK